MTHEISPSPPGMGRIPPAHPSLTDEGEYEKAYDDGELKLICQALKSHVGETVRVVTDYPAMPNSTAVLSCTLMGATEARGTGGSCSLRDQTGFRYPSARARGLCTRCR